VTVPVDLRDVFCVFPSPRGGVAALQGLTLAVPAGETCVVLGPSGSGKTTLMRVLAGLQQPSAGGVRVAGVDLTSLSPRALAAWRSRHLGYADQHYWLALAGELSAVELVEVPLGLGGESLAARRGRSLELLERVGLADRADARPEELSGGEQQRIALAAALATRPDVLVADEPTGELDGEAADGIYTLLEELVAEHGTTAVVVSHDPESVRIADRVVHIRDGRVSEESAAGDGVAVIAPGGWLRVPEHALRGAGIGGRARVVLREGAVELQPLGASDGAMPAPAPSAAPAGREGVVVETRELTRAYGDDVVFDELSVRFEPFAFSVVTGPSGSGKSTLLTLLAGLDVPDGGEVVVGNLPLSQLDRDERARARRGLVAYVGQAPALAGFLTARESVELALGLYELGGAEARERAEEALCLVDLVSHADRRVELLSAGQQERVALARALASRAAVLLVDEPTARLDLATTAEIGRLLTSLAHDRGTTVVCATHDPLLVEHADAEVRLHMQVTVRSPS
jgi:ABC-type lipoprotein export system ATPase subunit